jgi:hypothetical protein
LHGKLERISSTFVYKYEILMVRIMGNLFCFSLLHYMLLCAPISFSFFLFCFRSFSLSLCLSFLFSLLQILSFWSRSLVVSLFVYVSLFHGRVNIWYFITINFEVLVCSRTFAQHHLLYLLVFFVY